MPILREESFNWYLFLQGNVYKQITGYVALFFVVLEMVLTLRKRGRGWKIKIVLPGSMQFWRVLHIFMGVALVAVTAVHTVGVRGLNFNAAFLWVFFGVSLSALVGVVAETGVVESSKRYFKLLPFIGGQGVQKGALIRNLRAVWLSTHIFLVSAFIVMLGFHIFLAYYYQ
ncbi:hypothetical protein FRE64_06740 [Euhalothece natronophila Z-M001]|uniref:Uncharacterized protein n=1 Tax=Euhalothece natronophila Z-M001 TaxID=522448 RepID=A0A5B8NKQ7_9CHRO|nr:hypothetical protein [Euhalothece natronophila]QDZ39654.1 hypothetical protein FRE64_06740 [Euhalothece natronophila Z-M001]